MKTFERLFNYVSLDEIDTGTHNVTDARGQSISRGVCNGVAFANFEAHEFSYLNITSLGTDNVFNGKQCGVACVNTPSCFSFNLAQCILWHQRKNLMWTAPIWQVQQLGQVYHQPTFPSLQYWGKYLTYRLFEMHFDNNVLTDYYLHWRAREKSHRTF